MLVTRFEDYIDEINTYCYGRALADRIRNKKQVPIKAYYAETLAPRSTEEAKTMQKKYNADIVLWGVMKNLEQKCEAGDLCIKLIPSDTLKIIVGGKVTVEKDDLHYEQKIGTNEIEQGDFHIKEQTFDQWLIALFNAKVGIVRPDLYLIDSTLNKEELAEAYSERGSLWHNLSEYDKAISDYRKSMKLDNSHFLSSFVLMNMTEIERDQKIIDTKIRHKKRRDKVR